MDKITCVMGSDCWFRTIFDKLPCRGFMSHVFRNIQNNEVFKIYITNINHRPQNCTTQIVYKLNIFMVYINYLLTLRKVQFYYVIVDTHVNRQCVIYHL